MDQGKKRIAQTNQVQERNDQSNIEYGRRERFIIGPRTQVPDEFCGGNGDGKWVLCKLRAEAVNAVFNGHCAINQEAGKKHSAP